MSTTGPTSLPPVTTTTPTTTAATGTTGRTGGSDKPKKAKCPPSRGASPWLKVFYTFAAELFAVFFFGWIAVGGATIVPAHGGTLSALGNALLYTALIWCVIMVFGQFDAGHLALHITVANFFATSAWNSARKALTHFAIVVAQFVGYLLGALMAQWVANGGAPLANSCANPAGTSTLGIQIVTVLLVKMLVGHAYLLSARRFSGPHGAAAIALIVGFSILVLSGAAGGAFNFFRYLGFGWVGGCFTTSTLLIELFTGIGAGLVNWLLSVTLFGEWASNKSKRDSIAEKKTK